jgi:parvulin-like peptidyl-prolyl isomerase
MQWVREKFGTLFTGAIIAFIAFIFVVSGVFSGSKTRGLGEGAVAGTVNGDSITLSEYNRALNQRMEFFKNMGGGKLSDEQLKAFRVREGVFQELVRRKVVEQEAVKQGLEASDDEVMERIREIPAFQKDGQFDVETYKMTLASNNYTAGSFERMVRGDLSAQAWQSYFRNRTKVSNAELKQQFELNEDKRDIKYALISTEAARHAVKVDQAEVDKFLADPGKVNMAKGQWEAKKSDEYKNMTFDMAKPQIAREILASEKGEEVKKISDRLADQVVAAMTADKGSDSKVNAILKPIKAEVKSTGLMSAGQKMIPGAGEVPELFKDAFGASALTKPRKYMTSAGIVVAVVTQTQKPDLSKLESSRSALIQQIAGKKQRAMYDDWLKRITAKANVDPNPAVMQSEG